MKSVPRDPGDPGPSDTTQETGTTFKHITITISGIQRNIACVLGVCIVSVKIMNLYEICDV